MCGPGNGQLPQVQADAVVALRHLVDALDEGSAGALKAMLPRLLGDLFGLMGKLPEIDDLVSTLETLVECFGEDIAPYALDLVRQLTQAFWRLQQVGQPCESCPALVGCMQLLVGCGSPTAAQYPALPGVRWGAASTSKLRDDASMVWPPIHDSAGWAKRCAAAPQAGPQGLQQAAL